MAETPSREPLRQPRQQRAESTSDVLGVLGHLGSVAVGSLRGRHPRMPYPPAAADGPSWEAGWTAGYDLGRAEAFSPDPRPLSALSGRRTFRLPENNEAARHWVAFVEAHVAHATRGDAVEAVVAWSRTDTRDPGMYALHWHARPRRKGDPPADGVRDDGRP